VWFRGHAASPGAPRPGSARLAARKKRTLSRLRPTVSILVSWVLGHATTMLVHAAEATAGGEELWSFNDGRPGCALGGPPCAYYSRALHLLVVAYSRGVEAKLLEGPRPPLAIWMYKDSSVPASVYPSLLSSHSQPQLSSLFSSLDSASPFCYCRLSIASCVFSKQFFLSKYTFLPRNRLSLFHSLHLAKLHSFDDNNIVHTFSSRETQIVTSLDIQLKKETDKIRKPPI
jgi:hypothetical protein